VFSCELPSGAQSIENTGADEIGWAYRLQGYQMKSIKIHAGDISDKNTMTGSRARRARRTDSWGFCGDGAPGASRPTRETARRGVAPYKALVNCF